MKIDKSYNPTTGLHIMLVQFTDAELGAMPRGQMHALVDGIDSLCSAADDANWVVVPDAVPSWMTP